LFISDPRRAPLAIAISHSAAFHVDVRHDGDGTRVALYGDLDMATAPDADHALLIAEHDGGGRILLDLSGLRFIDVSGLRLIVGARRRLRHRLSILRGPGDVHRVFELTHTTHSLPFAD
jgi:anti-anti-sigma factor